MRVWCEEVPTKAPPMFWLNPPLNPASRRKSKSTNNARWPEECEALRGTTNGREAFVGVLYECEASQGQGPGEPLPVYSTELRQ